MSELFDKWVVPTASILMRKEVIKTFALDLSFEKAKNMAKCWGKDDLILQYYDSSKNNGKGLNDEIPLPIVLKIKKKDNVLIFEQTEYTNKYLSKN